MRKSWLIILSLSLAALMAGGCGGGDDPDPCEGLTLCATAGDMQCNSGGTAIQTCAANADACLVWSDTTTCGARQACDASGANPVCACNDTCNTEDDTQCATDTVQTCTADADGCLAWANTTDCTASNETCVNGACEATAVCTDGETRCEANWVETCADNAWVQTTDCATDTCVIDAGTAICETAVTCTDGETRCEANWVETCAANTWVQTTDCTPAGDTCQVDAGVAQCQGGVVCTDGETRCEANWVETCANNAWVQTTDCATDICVLDAGVAICQAPIACNPACDATACMECDTTVGTCVTFCGADEVCNAGVCEAGGGCIELVYAGNIAPYDGYLSSYYSDLSTTLGDAGLLDNGQFEFYDATTGTVDLASSGLNDNYATCMQCVRVFEDNDETTGPARQYFQESGTMIIDAANDPQTGVLAMELADVTLVEVTIAEDYTSTPVQDGACLHITAVSLDTSIEGCTTEGATQCAGDVIQTCTGGVWADGTDCSGSSQLCEVADGTAECVDSVCTSDPCAGVTNSDGVCTVIDASTHACGCNDGYSWDSTSLTCEVQTCTEIVYAGNLDGTNPYFADFDTALGDAGLVDYGQFEFYDATTGTVDLASSGLNDNYATCMQCVRIFEDYDEGTSDIARQYFQESGTMVIDASSDPVNGTLVMDLADVTLVEVTIAGDWTSTPVVGGECIHITAVSLDTSIDYCNTEGDTQCAGDVVRTCTGGVWVDGTDCSDNSQLCDVVAGTAECVDSPCTSDPCATVTDSDGVCTVIDTSTYACGCSDGYLWDDTSLTCEVITCNATTITAGTTSGDTCNGTNMYSPPSGGCTGYSANANEDVYELVVGNGESYTLVLTYTTSGIDTSLWATTDCLDFAGDLCTFGADDTYTDEPETMTIDVEGTYYVVVDGFSSGDCGAYDLVVTQN